MLNTIQMDYELLRSVTSEDTALDGTTASYTYQSSDMPRSVFTLRPEFNGAEIYFTGTGDDNTTASYKLFGYAENGPAELLCSGTLTRGAGVAGTGVYYIDTITCTGDKGWNADDSENTANRPCLLQGDLYGLKYLYLEIRDIDGAGEMTGVTAYIRGY